MANWGDVLYLIPMTTGTDDAGFPTEQRGESRLIYANRMSVRSNEFHMAKQHGVELQHMFEVRSIEYDFETLVRYNDKEYDVERTYEKGEFIELVLKKQGDQYEA
ncbi:hypothetical protein [Alkalibacillus salilacus]|uniref:Phage head-tail adapter protein n=1 Tax=Alkalibacillus salilacus TaxID=284582 RepID=A0ABT9VDD9_9BACI|nr:hypothetical protein [Alkalibacillus salilacus]MDQ0158963.1 hypothetical protein [Alkalibacillus salilacus]